MGDHGGPAQSPVTVDGQVIEQIHCGSNSILFQAISWDTLYLGGQDDDDDDDDKMMMNMMWACLSFLVSLPSSWAASRWRSGFEAPVKLNTAGAVMH